MGKNMEMIKVLSAWVEIDELLLPGRSSFPFIYEYFIPSLSKGRKYTIIVKDIVFEVRQPEFEILASALDWP